MCYTLSHTTAEINKKKKKECIRNDSGNHMVANSPRKETQLLLRDIESSGTEVPLPMVCVLYSVQSCVCVCVHA